MLILPQAGQGAAVQALWTDVLALDDGACPSLDLLHAFMHACNCCCQVGVCTVAFLNLNARQSQHARGMASAASAEV